jgi:hypothetical protein
MMLLISPNDFSSPSSSFSSSIGTVETGDLVGATVATIGETSDAWTTVLFWTYFSNSSTRKLAFFRAWLSLSLMKMWFSFESFKF